jgi:signal transduction histidine kinase
VDTAPQVHGWWDRLRLEQVVTNLVSNAIRYGAGRPIHARVEVVGENARLVVRDEGIGIPPEAQERIFGKFERAVSERHSGGLGLGLYITRSIVEAMGGSIQVESRPGQGSTFTVELPRSRQE